MAYEDHFKLDIPVRDELIDRITDALLNHSCMGDAELREEIIKNLPSFWRHSIKKSQCPRLRLLHAVRAGRGLADSTVFLELFRQVGKWDHKLRNWNLLRREVLEATAEATLELDPKTCVALVQLSDDLGKRPGLADLIVPSILPYCRAGYAPANLFEAVWIIANVNKEDALKALNGLLSTLNKHFPQHSGTIAVIASAWRHANLGPPASPDDRSRFAVYFDVVKVSCERKLRLPCYKLRVQLCKVSGQTKSYPAYKPPLPQLHDFSLRQVGKAIATIAQDVEREYKARPRLFISADDKVLFHPFDEITFDEPFYGSCRLGWQYPIAVRWRRRLHYVNNWQRKCDHLRSSSSSLRALGAACISLAPTDCPQGVRGLLQPDDTGLLVHLAFAPSKRTTKKWLLHALYFGVPIALWVREQEFCMDLRGWITRAVAANLDVDALPEEVQSLRMQTERLPPGTRHFARHLTLLYDTDECQPLKPDYISA